jgi:proline dehydrogenase
MNKAWLVSVGSRLGLAAIRLRLPFVDEIIKKTIFEQFCGGTTLLESQKVIDKLFEQGVYTILDYSAEGKENEEDYNVAMNETIRAIEFASRSESVLVVSTKISGLASNRLLEKMQKTDSLTEEDQYEFDNVMKRVDSICYVADSRNVSVFFDAEEYAVQDTIDSIVNRMMERYNKKRAVVYNTYQLYRRDRLQYLMDSFSEARKGGYILGAKLVRGAYMQQERDRATRLGYPDPIQPNKAATDDAYNTAVRFCIENYEHIAMCNASHNADSCKLQAQLIQEKGLPKDHPHFLISQLYGMGDNITFNLAKYGFKASKYLPYGPVRDVIPYLIRRAQENTSVTGDMSREMELISREMKRRDI